MIVHNAFNHLSAVGCTALVNRHARLYLAMKLVDGPDLGKMITPQRPLPWNTVLQLTGMIEYVWPEGSGCGFGGN